MGTRGRVPRANALGWYETGPWPESEGAVLLSPDWEAGWALYTDIYSSHLQQGLRCSSIAAIEEFCPAPVDREPSRLAAATKARRRQKVRHPSPFQSAASRDGSRSGDPAAARTFVLLCRVFPHPVALAGRRRSFYLARRRRPFHPSRSSRARSGHRPSAILVGLARQHVVGQRGNEPWREGAQLFRGSVRWPDGSAPARRQGRPG